MVVEVDTGRILAMASYPTYDPSIWIGGVKVASKGAVDPGYDEQTIVPHMKGREIDIKVHVGVGRGKAKVWTCDLTHGYISINADYRS